MSNQPPRVSIGVPVYNGASLLQETLENLQNQSFRDFEVILSDNGSTDATPDICQRFSQKDTRFTHVHHPFTSEPVKNFYFARDSANAGLFMWRAYDDLSALNYVEELVRVHDTHPNTLLAVSNIVRDASKGTRAKSWPYTSQDTGQRLPRIVRQVFGPSHSWYYGLWQQPACVEITDRLLDGYPDYWGGDRVTIFAAALRDGIRGTSATTFHQRMIMETRDYVARPKPGYSEMVDRNTRFSAICRTLLDESDLQPLEKTAIRALIPYFTRRRCHSTRRILRARLRGK